MTDYYKAMLGYEDWDTRAAVEMTWGENTIIKHISLDLGRWVETSHPNSFANLEWEFREGTETGLAGLNNSVVKREGSWVFDNDAIWPPFQRRWQTAVFTSPMTISSTKYYWIVIKIPNDVDNVKYCPAWYFRKGGSCPPSHGQMYTYFNPQSVWTAPANWWGHYQVTSAQAGIKYHAVIDGQGYMTPDQLRSYNCQLTSQFGANLRGGMQKYSQLQYPYANFSQDSFRHGMGWLRLEDPKTYWFGHGLDMRVDGQTILAPLSQYTAVSDGSVPGTRQDYYTPANRMPIELPWRKHSSLLNTTKAVAGSFLLKAGATAYGVSVQVRQSAGNAAIQGNFTFKLCADIAGNPDYATPLRTVDITNQCFNWLEWIWIDFADYTAGLTDETLWLVFEVDTDNFSSHEIWVHPVDDASGTLKYYLSNTWYTDTNYKLVFIASTKTVIQDWSDLEHPGFFKEFGGGLYFAYHQTVFKWDEVAYEWSEVDTVAGQECKGLEVFGDYLYTAWGSGAVTRRSSDGTTWADVAGDNADLLWIGQGFMWKKGAAEPNKAYYTNDGTSWSAAIAIGTSEYKITGFCLFNDVVVVAKENALYYIDRDYLAHEYFDYEDQADEKNGINLKVWSNNVYIPVLSGLWRWTGSIVDKVGPNQHSGLPKRWGGRVADMVSIGNWLFVAYDNQGVAENWSSLLVYNGIGWQCFVRSRPKAATGRLTALYVTTDIGNEIRLWMFTGYRLEYITMSPINENHFEWEDALFEPEGWMVTAWWDGELYNAKKYFNNVTFIADNLLDSGNTRTYIDIYYQLDGVGITDTQYYLGRLDAGSSNPQTFHLPDETEGYSIRLIFYFFTTDATESPRMRSYNIEALVRPSPSYAHSIALTVADDVMLMDGEQETATSGELWTHLQEAQAKVAPIIVHLPFKTFRGFVSSLQERTHQFKEQGDTPKWERYVLASFVEA